MATEEVSQPLQPGVRAPAFTLPVAIDRVVSLEDLAGSPVVLAFYPADFSPVCTDELALFNELMPEFQRHGARIFGISTDSIWSHRAFAKERRLRFPLLSDFHPKGEVSRQYRSYSDKDGFPDRSLFVIDGNGTVFWSYLSPRGVNPGADGILDALERLSSANKPAEIQP